MITAVAVVLALSAAIVGHIRRGNARAVVFAREKLRRAGARREMWGPSAKKTGLVHCDAAPSSDCRHLFADTIMTWNASHDACEKCKRLAAKGPYRAANDLRMTYPRLPAWPADKGWTCGERCRCSIISLASPL